MLFYVLMLFYFITFTSKCFVLAIAAISAELKAILLEKLAKLYNFYVALLIWHTLANSAQNSPFTESHSSDIPNHRHEFASCKNKPICFLLTVFFDCKSLHWVVK